jgi:eukaryotic-like serine/threonine-protein kinase
VARWGRRCMPCPEENVVVGFLRGDLSDGERSQVESHIDTCSSCGALVADLARIYGNDGTSVGGGPLTPELVEMSGLSESIGSSTLVDNERKTGPLLSEGAKLGRYVVLHVVGAGGMGIVYAAYDPELDRKVALKLLMDGGPGASVKTQAEHRIRLLREAQVMAKLQHPNVITVHDVGTFEDRVFIAMEFVEGCTLKHWLRGGTHAWKTVLSVFLAAGRGLAAAHAAGLVHRDFKPDNVLLSSGPLETPTRIMVTDFGLARPAHGHTDAFVAVGSEPSEQVISAQLTQTGALVGTPAYMAPEQLAGQRIDALSDQFSFCVALYEGLFGERPFSGKGLAELVANVSEGRVRPPPRDAQIPRWIRQTVLKGLATDPGNRHSGMDSLLGRLERDPWRPWRRRVAPLGLATLAGGVAVAIGTRTPALRPCRDAGRQLEEIWNDARREGLTHAFASAEVSWAEPTLRAATDALDRWGDDWVEARRHVCHATQSGEQSTALLDARMTCLDASAVRFAALVDVLEGADQAVLEHALPAIGALEPPSDCITLMPSVAPESDPAYVAPQREALARVEALLDASRYADAMREIEPVLEQTKTLRAPVLRAEALLLLGRAQSLTGDVNTSVTTLREAVFLAQSQGASSLQARIALKLALVAGDRAARLDEGELWVEYAAAELSRGDPTLREQAALGHVRAVLLLARADYPAAISAFEQAIAQLDAQTDALRIATIVDDLGNALRHAARYDEAIARHKEALERREALLGTDHPEVARTLSNLALSVQDSGRREEAIALHDEALARRERALGSDHPDVATSLAHLASVYSQTGRYAEAEPLLHRALDIRERTLGPRHVEVGSTLTILGLVHERMGRLEEAVEYHRRSLSVQEAARGADHPRVALALNNLANVMAGLGRDEESVSLYERAIAIQERAEVEHPNLAVTLANLANVLTDLGDHERAIALHHRALALRERALPADHPDLVYSLRGLARTLMTAKREAEALEPLERALALVGRAQVDPALGAAVRFDLAQGLWSTKTDRGRARKLARMARDTFRTGGPREAGISAEIDAWLVSTAEEK